MSSWALDMHSLCAMRDSYLKRCTSTRRGQKFFWINISRPTKIEAFLANWLRRKKGQIGDLDPWSVSLSSQHYWVTPETCDLWDIRGTRRHYYLPANLPIWSVWWGNMSWPIWYLFFFYNFNHFWQILQLLISITIMTIMTIWAKWWKL